MSLPIESSAKSSGGLIDDLLGIFVTPAEVFERRRNSSFVMPALVQMVLFLLLAIGLHNLMAPFVDADFARGIAKATEKAAAAGRPFDDNARAMMEKVKSATQYALPTLLPWFIAIIGGVVVWLVGKIVGAQFAVGQGMTISAWSLMPAILGTIVVGIFGTMADPESVRGMSDAQLGPARFVDPATVSPLLLTVLTRLDVFSIWSVILTGIGISVVGRVSRASGIGAAAIQWVAVSLVFGACASMGG